MKHIKVLFLENNDTDVQLMQYELQKAGFSVEEEVVEKQKDFEQKLDKFKPDVVLCDYNLPEYDGISAIKYIIRKDDNLPVIMVTGSLDEESAVEMMKIGAWDYVVKEHLSRLGPSVSRSLTTRDEKLQKTRALNLLKKSEKKYRSLYENAGTGLFQSTLDGTRFLAFNQIFASMLGYKKSQLLNISPQEIWYRPDERGFFINKLKKHGKAEGYLARMRSATAQIVYTLISARLSQENEHELIEGSIVDVTQKQRDELLRDIIYNISDATTTAETLNDLLVTINFELSRLIKSKNLLIGLTNEKNDMLALPFMRDEQKVLKSFPLKLTISKLVIESGKSLFLKKDQLLALKNEGEIETIRTLPAVWLGVPLSVGNRVFGILVLQDYQNPDAFSEEDMRLLSYVGKQVSMAIHEKQDKEEIMRLKMGIEQAPLSILITDPEANIQYVNPYFEKLSGYTTNEAKGKNPRILQSGETPQNTYKELWDTVTQGKVWKGEFLNKKKNNELYWESAVVSPVYNSRGKLMNYIGLKEDITQKKMVEDALQESEKKFKAITNQAHDGIVMVDDRFRVVFWNQACEKMFGYTAEEISGKPFNEIILTGQGSLHISPEKIKNFAQTDRGFFIGKTHQLIIKTKGNKPIDTELTFASIQLSGKWYVVSIIRDITMRKKYEEGLENARKKAEESDRLKTSFLTSVTHELRTPLNAIIGFSDLIMNTFNVPEIHDFASNIHNSGIHLLWIIEDILNLSLIESNNLKLKTELISIRSFEQDLWGDYEMVNSKYKKDHIPFSIQISEKLKNMKIYTDEKYLIYINSIMIDNALKFTRNGSISVNMEAEGDQLVVQIKDTGIGIPPGKQQIIFERFRQVEDTLTRNYGGTGIGLTIARSIAQLMGGTISVSSEPGKGSEFTLKIPGLETKQEKEPGKHAVAEGPKNLQGKKILIAEDEELNYLLLKGLLSKFGAQLIHAGNGKEAIDLYKQHPDTDLVLMDIRMPVMNGLEATESLKKINPGLPVVAVTAYNMQEDKERAMKAGCNDFLTKPVNKDLLFSTIGKYTGN